MRNPKHLVAVAAISCMLIEPVFAAEDYRPPEMGQQRTISAYAGGTLRLSVGTQSRVTPRAALAMGFMQKSGSAGSSAPLRRRVVEMVSFGGTPRSEPKFMIAGVPARDFDRKLGMSTLGAIAIGGVLAVGAIVALAAAAGPKIPDDTFSGF